MSTKDTRKKRKIYARPNVDMTTDVLGYAAAPLSNAVGTDYAAGRAHGKWRWFNRKTITVRSHLQSNELRLIEPARVRQNGYVECSVGTLEEE